MADKNNLKYYHKEEIDIIPKETTRYFLFVQINYQIIRNQPIFESVQMFDHNKKILTMYDSPPVDI